MEISVNTHFKSKPSIAGIKAEKALVKALRYTRLFKVQHLTRKGTDIRAIRKDSGEVFNIEVKYARQGKDGKYRATTYKVGSQDHSKSDYIVFLCQPPHKGGTCIPFIIPVEEFGDKHHIVITSNPVTYSGRYSKYRNAWEHIIR